MSKVIQIYIYKHRLQSAKPTEAKFHVELLWVIRMKGGANGLGHVTKMAAMHIFGKNPLKITKTRRLMTFKLGIQHQELKTLQSLFK